MVAITVIPLIQLRHRLTNQSSDSNSEVEKALGSLPDFLRAHILFSFERSTERTIWVWLFSSLTLLLSQSFESLSKVSKGVAIIVWTIYMGFLLIWAQLPQARTYRGVRASFSADDATKVYERACGVKETLMGNAIIVLASGVLLLIFYYLG